jgi:lactoylglutathione lyase
MKIDHLAFWVEDLETVKEFYVHYFQGSANQIYCNPSKQFTSYFITFESGARLELMQKTAVTERTHTFHRQSLGITHLAFQLGSVGTVNALTERLRADGYEIAGEPRYTGDGNYESIILDPEGNTIEFVA